MTPKEKAFEIFWQYIYEVVAKPEKAKKCALIAVDEIIKFGNSQGFREPMMYWYKVKEELEKL